MNPDQWNTLEKEILGAWQTTSARQNAIKMAWWKARFEGESLATMRQVVAVLEHGDHRGWPNPGEIYAVLKAEKRKSAPDPIRREREPEGPISSAEYTSIVGQLCVAASAAKDDRWKAYLYDLADFYEANRLRVAAGQVRLWPPPKIGGFFGPVLNKIATNTPLLPDSDPRRKDEYEAFV